MGKRVNASPQEFMRGMPDHLVYVEFDEFDVSQYAYENAHTPADYGTCHKCGEWKPLGFCPKGH